MFSPRVLEAIDRLTFDFCDATNRTSVMELGRALQQLHAELAAGLELGEAVPRLNARVGQIFASPYRAARIAQTESSRAMHSGQFLAAQETEAETGLKIRKRWLASSDACDACKRMNGRVVGLEEDFAVEGTGTYSRIPYPPYHPHCMCTWTEVLE